MRRFLSLVMVPTLLFTAFFSFAPDVSGQRSDDTENTGNSLGAMTGDGGSPGYIIGRSYRDDQAHLSPGRMIDWRNGPQIHFVFAAQALPGHDDAGIARWVEYGMFDPTVGPDGQFLPPTWLQSNPLVSGGWYPNLDVDESGHAIPVCDEFNPADPLQNSTVYWDMFGPGSWGLFIPDVVPQALSLDPAEYIRYPRIEYQEYNGQYILHLLTLEEYNHPTCDADAITYWRKTMSSASDGPSASWTTRLITEWVWSNQYDIAASRDGSGNVGIVWVEWPDYCQNSATDGVLYAITSSDAGATWAAQVEISDPSSANMPWVDISALYDTDGYLHAVYNASPSGEIDPSWIYHWSDRTAGPFGSGSISAIHVAEGVEHMCGRGQTNVALTAKPIISQCNDKLYVVWQQYGNATRGDTLDCADPSFPNSYGPRPNAEIYMAVSNSLDGLFWDRARNLTNSHTPGCDGSNESNCDHDAFASMSRYGMNTADFGTTHWSAASQAMEVRDVLEPTFPDEGRYLDVQYTNDLFPEAARYMDDEEYAIWTYNPIKWFRLPCVNPVAGPCAFLQYDEFAAPLSWVKTGTEEVIEDVPISGMCNEPLLISSIEVNVTVGPDASVTVPAWPTTIPAGGTDYFSIVINPAGLINPTPGTWVPIEADIIVHSNDPNVPSFTRFHINTVVADTVVSIVIDTVNTGLPMYLAVASNGNAGLRAPGGVNLDFSQVGECDGSADVYLNDLTPVVMTAQDSYSWWPHWSPTSTNTASFRPVDEGTGARSAFTPEFDYFYSGTFVNTDSTLGFRKSWFAPAGSVDYVMERWDVFSYDGSPHNAIALGEWVDWDVPSYNGTDNDGGVVVNPSGPDYVWQRGVIDPAPEEPPCTPDDMRYGVSGLLGYYFASEFRVDTEVNHTDLWGGFVVRDEAIFSHGIDNMFIPDSAWAHLHRNSFEADNSVSGDKQSWLSFGSFDIVPDDTLCIWIVHASVYNGYESDIQATIDEAETWYLMHRPYPGPSTCCGQYTQYVYPFRMTGNCNCSEDGKVTLADITCYINKIYIWPGFEPCCPEAMNANGSVDGKVTLSDVTAVIDHVFISKKWLAPCAW